MSHLTPAFHTLKIKTKLNNIDGRFLEVDVAESHVIGLHKFNQFNIQNDFKTIPIQFRLDYELVIHGIDQAQGQVQPVHDLKRQKLKNILLVLLIKFFSLQ